MNTDINIFLNQFKSADSDTYRCLDSLKKTFVNRDHLHKLQESMKGLEKIFCKSIDWEHADQAALLNLKEKILKFDTEGIKPKTLCLIERIKGLIWRQDKERNQQKTIQYAEESIRLKKKSKRLKKK